MSAKLRRREFITLFGGAATWPLAARAQQLAKVARIGFLGPAPASSYWSRVEGLLAGLRDLGYVEGKNIVIEFRWAERVEQLPELAAELVRMKVDIIFASSSTFVEPARQATKRSLSCSRPMLTPSASGTWRASHGPAEISRGCRCFSLISPPRSWKFSRKLCRRQRGSAFCGIPQRPRTDPPCKRCKPPAKSWESNSSWYLREPSKSLTERSQR
jgi:hypothetical protein